MWSCGGVIIPCALWWWPVRGARAGAACARAEARAELGCSISDHGQQNTGSGTYGGGDVGGNDAYGTTDNYGDAATSGGGARRWYDVGAMPRKDAEQLLLDRAYGSKDFVVRESKGARCPRVQPRAAGTRRVGPVAADCAMTPCTVFFRTGLAKKPE